MSEVTLGNANPAPADPATPPVSTPAVTPSSGEPKSWRDSLPEDIRTNAAISSFKDVEALAKSHISAQALIGKKGVIVPNEKATPEEWNNFYQQIGVPEADKYEIAAPKDFKGDISKYKEIALKTGLLPKQAAALLEWQAGNEAESAKAEALQEKASVQKDLETLQQEWGDAYKKNLGAGELFLKEKGGKEAIDFLVETGLSNNPVIIKLLSAAGKLMGEDKLREGGVTGDGQSPSEIKSALEELRANGDKNGLFDKNHPMHASSLAKMESLAKRLTGGR